MPLSPMVEQTRFIWFPLTLVLGSLLASLFLCLGLSLLRKSESYFIFCWKNVMGYFFVILSMNYIYFVVVAARNVRPQKVMAKFFS
jgi:hypothetical protein